MYASRVAVVTAAAALSQLVENKGLYMVCKLVVDRIIIVGHVFKSPCDERKVILRVIKIKVEVIL